MTVADIGPSYEASIIKFLTKTIGTGTWGCRVEDGKVVVKVLPQWVELMSDALDSGEYNYTVTPARKKTGVTVFTLVSRGGSKVTTIPVRDDCVVSAVQSVSVPSHKGKVVRFRHRPLSLSRGRA